ncbi:MAG TPA: preprotein translocase subunit SecG [Nordella sp.]|nr:preprotein translocase subunit SecG [Nordella sp.]
MQTVLLVVHLIIALALIAVVLLQRSEGGALGIGGGGGAGSLFSARGVGNTLTRTTAVLAVIFFMTSIGLTLLAGRTGGSLFNHPATQGQTAPTGTGDSILPSLPPAGQNQNQQGGGTGTGGTGQPQVPVSQ